MKTTPPSPNHVETDELADLFDVDPGSVRRWRHLGCPAVKVNGRLWFDPTRVAAWRKERGMDMQPNAKSTPELPVRMPGSLAWTWIKVASWYERRGYEYPADTTVDQWKRLASLMNAVLYVMLLDVAGDELDQSRIEPDTDVGLFPSLIKPMPDRYWRALFDRFTPNDMNKLADGWNRCHRIVFYGDDDGEPTPKTTRNKGTGKR